MGEIIMAGEQRKDANFDIGYLEDAGEKELGLMELD
jgi:hypothetical protein